jgi:hypothetical protein
VKRRWRNAGWHPWFARVALRIGPQSWRVRRRRPTSAWQVIRPPEKGERTPEVADAGFACSSVCPPSVLDSLRRFRRDGVGRRAALHGSAHRHVVGGGLDPVLCHRPRLRAARARRVAEPPGRADVRRRLRRVKQRCSIRWSNGMRDADTVFDEFGAIRGRRPVWEVERERRFHVVDVCEQSRRLRTRATAALPPC